MWWRVVVCGDVWWRVVVGYCIIINHDKIESVIELGNITLGFRFVRVHGVGSVHVSMNRI